MPHHHHYSHHPPPAARLVLGILGNMATTAFLLSSLPTAVKILRERSLGGLSCDLYAFKLFNCLLWTVYGLPMVHPHNLWVLLTNSMGCLLSLLYISSCLHVATAKERWGILWKLLALALLFTLTVLALFLVEHSQARRIMVIGVLCATVGSCMHLTLLSQLRTTLYTRRSKYMYPKTSTMAFMKSAIWAAYGLTDYDLYIIIPNGVGVATALVQLLVAAHLALASHKASHSDEAAMAESGEAVQKAGAAGEAAIASSDGGKEDPELQPISLAHVLSNLQTRGLVVPIDEITMPAHIP